MIFCARGEEAGKKLELELNQSEGINYQYVVINSNDALFKIHCVKFSEIVLAANALARHRATQKKTN